MIFWACSFITLSAAIAATFIGDIRRAVLALWVVGLGTGGLFLHMGAELLAVVQWIVSTLVAISFIFYAVMFGEYGVVDPRSRARKAISAIVPVVLGASFAGVIWLGARHLPGAELPGLETAGPAAAAAANGQNVAALGRIIADDHILSLEILGLMLFLVIVGSGVVARAEVNEP